MSQDEKPEGRKKRHRLLLIISIIVLVCAILWFCYWLLIARFHVRTDDAYVAGNQVMLTPQVPGGVKAIYAEETDLVIKGQLVVELDCLDIQLEYQDKEAALAQTTRNVKELFEMVVAKEAEVLLRAAELRQAELDFEHRQPLVLTGAVSVEEFEQYQTNVDTATAQLAYAAQTLVIAEQRVKNTTVETHPLVLEAVSVFKEAYLNLVRCQIWSPVTGYVAKRTVQVGDRVKVSDTLLVVVPLDDLWFQANYKETKLRHVRIGQPVTFWADIYGPMTKFHGKVIGFQAGTGNAFALLPAENASGNWIKIIQRVPIRVSIDAEDLKRHPLVIGLSLHASIDVSNRDGKMLTQTPTEKPIYTTPIYQMQSEYLEAMNENIARIIAENAA